MFPSKYIKCIFCIVLMVDSSSSLNLHLIRNSTTSLLFIQNEKVSKNDHILTKTKKIPEWTKDEISIGIL